VIIDEVGPSDFRQMGLPLNSSIIDFLTYMPFNVFCLKWTGLSYTDLIIQNTDTECW